MLIKTGKILLKLKYLRVGSSWTIIVSSYKFQKIR
jgi:hypothetical protein